MSSCRLKASRIYRSLGAALLLTLVFSVLSLPLDAQVYKFSVSGFAINGYGVFGSDARGGAFNYGSGWPEGPSDLGVWCQAGQPCQVDLPVEFYDTNDTDYTEGCLWSTCTPYIGGSISISTFSFKTPTRPDYGRVSVSGPVTVDGYVSGAYSNWQGLYGGAWELWYANFSGRGTETVELLGMGDGQYLALFAYARYHATGSATAEVSEIFAPGPGTSGVAIGNGSLFVSQAGAFGTISQLNKVTGAVLNTFLTPSVNGFDGRSSPSDIAFGQNHLFMTDIGSPGAGVVYDIDTAGTTIHNSFPLPFRGGALGFGGRRLFVGDLDSGQVLVTSPAGAPISSFALPFKAAGMVFDSANNWLWITSQTNPMKVWQFTTTGAQLGSCVGPWNPGGDGVGAISVSQGKLYIAEVGKDMLWEDRSVLSSVQVSHLNCSPALPTAPRLAINPGLPIKPIDPTSSGPISVAVLSSADFDAASIDPNTVRFGDTGTEAAPLDWVLNDMNGDGQNDLLLHFSIPNTAITCWTTVVSVTGKTFSGQSVRGSGAIWTIRCRQ
jgi:hypothetical protein